MVGGELPGGFVIEKYSARATPGFAARDRFAGDMAILPSVRATLICASASRASMFKAVPSARVSMCPVCTMKGLVLSLCTLKYPSPFSNIRLSCFIVYRTVLDGRMNIQYYLCTVGQKQVPDSIAIVDNNRAAGYFFFTVVEERQPACKQKADQQYGRYGIGLPYKTAFHYSSRLGIGYNIAPYPFAHIICFLCGKRSVYFPAHQCPKAISRKVIVLPGLLFHRKIY